MAGIDDWLSVARVDDPDDVRERILTGYRDGKPFTPWRHGTELRGRRTEAVTLRTACTPAARPATLPRFARCKQSRLRLTSSFSPRVSRVFRRCASVVNSVFSVASAFHQLSRRDTAPAASPDQPLPMIRLCPRERLPS
jgi:hypothetical protein